VLRKLGVGVRQNRQEKSINFFCLLWLVWIILATATTAQGKESDKGEPRSLDEYVKFMEFQIPGWQQQVKPYVKPVVKNDETTVITINTIFQSGMQKLEIKLIIPEKENVATMMGRVPKEDARPVQVDGFDAVQIAPPPNPFGEYHNSLNINVADRFVVVLDGTEILDPQTLINAAKAINLKKLAALPH
jgi:hypothetical protein